MNHKIVYFVDGEERSAAGFDSRRAVEDFLELLEVGTLYREYQLFNGAWEFIRQSKTQGQEEKPYQYDSQEEMESDPDGPYHED